MGCQITGVNIILTFKEWVPNIPGLMLLAAEHVDLPVPGPLPLPHIQRYIPGKEGPGPRALPLGLLRPPERERVRAVWTSRMGERW